ncbi:hypothetical protein JCM24511_09404 [Saitozyma sp. JCM 24511]|nr:hypothetical protein JCM24511_09404 [Saitozyma sp. JCM 24511]
MVRTVPENQRWRPQLTRRDLLHALFLGGNALGFVLVQLEVPDAYLDEIFHIPQTQRYCAGDWTHWDPAITTPPGLYILSALPLRALGIHCSPPLLRLTNLLFTTLLIPFLLSTLIASLSVSIASDASSIPVFSPRGDIRTRSLRTWDHFLRPSMPALVIASFPLITFFGNLYYTDVASLAGVLGAWALAMEGYHSWASLIGAWSITVRQTNVVWLAFVVGLSLLREVQSELLKSATKHDDRYSARPRDEALDGEVTGDVPLAEVRSVGQVLRGLSNLLRTAMMNPGKVARTAGPYIPTFAGFLAFLKWNGGIVLGHKELHQPVLHFPQLLYFLAFSTALCFPAVVAPDPLCAIRGALRLGVGSVRRAVASGVVAGLMLLAVHKATIIHPFLLADNRHYAFYLFRRVIRPYPIAKYLLCPGYLLAAWLWLWRLGRRATILWSVAFLGCTAAVLIPTPLVEPRYFLIPLIILRLQLEAAPCMSRKAIPTAGGSDVDTDATGVRGVRSVRAVDPDTAITARLRRGATFKNNGSASTPTSVASADAGLSKPKNGKSPSAQEGASAMNPADTDKGEARERGTPDQVLWIEWAWYGAIHSATLGLFLVRKFRWEGWEGWMRFMW